MIYLNGENIHENGTDMCALSLYHVKRVSIKLIHSISKIIINYKQ